jgi:5-(carboxyamino)imidazole ribonucleotide mutase
MNERRAEQQAPRVAVIMGSDSDWPVMQAAAEALAEFDIPLEVGVVSAHRTPGRMLDYSRGAADRGIEVIIAGAGGAAHLPGMVASATPLPVIGVPVPLAKLDGLDSLLSIVQMPAGVPVATVSIGGARNAGLLAVRILASADPALRVRVQKFQADLETEVLAKDRESEVGGKVPAKTPSDPRRQSWLVTRRSMCSGCPKSTMSSEPQSGRCAKKRSRPMRARVMRKRASRRRHSMRSMPRASTPCTCRRSTAGRARIRSRRAS